VSEARSYTAQYEDLANEREELLNRKASLEAQLMLLVDEVSDTEEKLNSVENKMRSILNALQTELGMNGAAADVDEGSAIDEITSEVMGGDALGDAISDSGDPDQG
jgi:uncharacterized protein YlxW (UPF0749 family)